MGALVVRVLLVAAIWFLADGTLFPDESGYTRLAAEAAEGRTAHWADSDTAPFYNQNATLLVPLTIAYFLFGAHSIAGPLMVGVFGAAAAAGVTRLALEATTQRWAMAAGLGVALLPSQVLWSSVVLKDATVWAVTVSIALAVALLGRSAGRRLVWTALSIAALMVVLAHARFHSLIVVAWALAVAGWMGDPDGRLRRGLLCMALAVGLPWAFGGGPGGVTVIRSTSGYTEHIRTAMAANAATALIPARPVNDDAAEPTDREVSRLQGDIRRLRRQLRSVGNGQDEPRGNAAERARLALRLAELEEELRMRLATRQVAKESAVRKELRYLPQGMSVMLLEPTPWRTAPTRNMQMVRLEMVLWYPLLLLAAVGVSQVWRRRRVLVFPVLAGTGIMVMYSLIEGNFGTAFRHRGEFVWVVMLLAAFGGEAVMRWRRNKRALPASVGLAS